MLQQDEIIWQNEVLEMARQTLSKDIDGLWLAGTPDLEAFAKLVAAQEREACADLCATWYDPLWSEHNQAGNELATAIRARGEA